MATVTVIGPGAVGSAVAGIAARGGADVQVLGRDHEKARAVAESLGGASGVLGDPVTGDIVVLAVPFDAIADVLARYEDGFAGRILVDVSNPVDFATFDGLVVSADASAAHAVWTAAPEARVVKAFNTNFAATLHAGTIGEHATVVLVAGDDAPAKEAVIELVGAAGLRGVDAGSLNRARELEAIGFLQLTLGAREAISWMGGFTLVG